MAEITKEYYVIIGFVTDAEEGYKIIYDANGKTAAYNWPRDKSRQFQFLTYQDAYKRFQEVYAFNRNNLDKYTFLLRLETFKFEEDLPKSADERAEELFNFYSKAK